MANLADAVSLLEHGDWQGAHEMVQTESSPLACWAHGIVHLMEGDRANAGYWYRRAGRALPEPADPGAEIEALRRNLTAASASQ